MSAKYEQEAPMTDSPFELLLGSEVLPLVLSFCDFPSALLFSRGTSRSLRQSLFRGDHFLWKEIFHRHRFSLPMMTQTWPSPDYIREIRKRRQLARNLLIPRSGKSSPRTCCFNLPNRCFNFVPITPDGLLADWDDPPPVDFDCDSFMLTSSAGGAELLLLDPFHGTLAVYDNCLDNAVASDEGMMEQAMLEAANLIHGNRENPSPDDISEEDIAGAVFERRVHRNHNITQYKKPPFQLLFRLDEDIDLDACFSREGKGGNRVVEELDVGYHGIDSKCILKDGNLVGTMVAVGRMFTKQIRPGINNNQFQRREEVVTELHMWTRRYSDAETEFAKQLYGSHKICRFPCSFQSIDLCASNQRVFVTFDGSNGPLLGSRSVSDEILSKVTASTVFVYPTLPFNADVPNKKQKSRTVTRHQEPELLIRCQAEVSSLAVDPGGASLLVGTTAGNCEVWSIQTGKDGAMAGKRKSIINIKSSISRAFEGRGRSDNDAMEMDADSTAMDASDDSTRMRRTLLAILNSPKIVSFHYPSHLPLSSCGFVTLQHSPTDGSSLLLWRKNDRQVSEPEDSYKIVSMINLPLSGTSRPPRVFYDGRRILIFGQDHIGLIVLIYHVLSSNEDIHLFQERINEETSGGVFNLTYPPRARFANRIRHAALGGLEYYESIHMTCNDRFIVVNTKSGNLLLSDYTSPYAEGLLVIDLQDD